MTVDKQGSNAPTAPAGNDTSTKDATKTQVDPAASAAPTEKPASGAGQPSAPKQADPPAAATPTDKPGTKTAQENPKESIQQEIENHPVLRHLAGKEPKQDDQKKSDVPKAKDDKAGNASADAELEPPADPKERNKAFAELRTALKAKDRELEKVSAEAEFGRELANVFTKAGVFEDYREVEDEQLAGVVAIQAAINRAESAVSKGGKPSEKDMAIIGRAIETMEAIAGKTGIQRGGNLPEPITGELPERWADMVSVGMVSEAEARQFAAIEKAKEAPPKAKPKAEPVEQKPTQKATPTRSEPEVDPDAHAERQLTKAHLIEQGIPKDQVTAHYKRNLLPIVLEDLIIDPLPGTDAAGTFLRMSPAKQGELIRTAQARWAKKQEGLKRPAGESAKKAGDPPPNPPMRRAHGRGLPPTIAGDTHEARAKNTLAFLAGAPAE